MAQTVARPRPRFVAPMLVVLFGFTSAVAEAAVETQYTSPAGSSLDGWGPYKFGITAKQMLDTGGLSWRQFSPPPGQIPNVKFFMAASEVDQFGLHHVSVIGNFDSTERLSSIDLSYHRGGLTPEACKTLFESLLTKVESQYGAFEPTDDNETGPGKALSKTDVIRVLPGGLSRYRDLVMGNFQVLNNNSDMKILSDSNPDMTFLSATAQRKYGEASIVVGMNVIENMKLPGALAELEKIPESVLAVAPNLANPICRLSVDFRSKNPALQGAFAAPQIPPQAPQAPPPAARTSTPPNQMAQNLTAFVAAAKKNGLMGPIDPVLDAYNRLRIANDDEDAAALLEKMTPSQTAMAAYSRHDYPLAIKLWTPMAEKGDAEAAASIGSLYEYNLNGVTQDYVQAAKWRKLAASEGDGGSQEALGDDYADGQGVPKDNVRAYMWLSLGLDQPVNGPWENSRPAAITKKRDAIAQQMSPTELTQANAMIVRCRASKYKSCD